MCHRNDGGHLADLFRFARGQVCVGGSAYVVDWVCFADLVCWFFINIAVDVTVSMGSVTDGGLEMAVKCLLLFLCGGQWV